jgi:hypothetical protein
MKFVEIIKKDITKTRIEKERILSIIANACAEEIPDEYASHSAHIEVYPKKIHLGKQQIDLPCSRPFYNNQAKHRKIVNPYKSEENGLKYSPYSIDNKNHPNCNSQILNEYLEGGLNKYITETGSDIHQKSSIQTNASTQVSFPRIVIIRKDLKLIVEVNLT